MKNMIFGTAAIVGSMMLAAPAIAAPLNINLQAAGIAQSQAGPVGQNATSIAARVGTVGNNDAVTSTAANLGQNASLDAALEQSTSGFVNGNLLGTAITQNLSGSVSQVAMSIAGTGSAGSYGSVTSTAANIAQNGSMTVRVTMH